VLKQFMTVRLGSGADRIEVVFDCSILQGQSMATVYRVTYRNSSRLEPALAVRPKMRGTALGPDFARFGW
jgi:hypothetical protein